MTVRHRLFTPLAVAGATLLLMTACGDEAPQVTTGSDNDSGAASPPDDQDDAPGQASAADAAPAGPGDIVVSCGDVTFDSLPADPSSFPPLGDIEGVIDLAAIQGEHEMFEVHDWYVVSETDDELVLFGEPHDPDPDASRHAYATLEPSGDLWVPASWGGCQTQVDAPGWGNARFVLDPDVEPDPESTVVSVRAWETECASGEAPEGREVRPVVLGGDAETVSILVLVEPVTGGAECPSNPSFPLEVELSAPLGDRTVVDASVDPPLERPWPPTESSLQEQGREE